MLVMRLASEQQINKSLNIVIIKYKKKKKMLCSVCKLAALTTQNKSKLCNTQNIKMKKKKKK